MKFGNRCILISLSSTGRPLCIKVCLSPLLSFGRELRNLRVLALKITCDLYRLFVIPHYTSRGRQGKTRYASAKLRD